MTPDPWVTLLVPGQQQQQQHLYPQQLQVPSASLDLHSQI